jgi:nitrile hydratase beta subunit
VNGPHDIGGLRGLGALPLERDEPVFHEDWEGRICGIALALGAVGNHTVDEFRHAIERMPWADYHSSSYYERWLFAIETLLAEKGVVSRIAREARAAARPPAPPATSAASPLAAALRHALRGSLPREPVSAPAPARFRAGDFVRARNLHDRGHVRLPGYVRGRTGRIVIHRGAFHHPSGLAHGGPRRGAHLYTVSFEAGELWGISGRREDVVNVDLFEDYLEAA